MSIKDVNFYNVASANQLGWQPNWFNCEYFDEELAYAIGEFQKTHNLEVDYCCGPMTYRIRRIELESNHELVMEKLHKLAKTDKKFIYCNGKTVEIPWTGKVITFKDKEGMSSPNGTFRTFQQGERKPKLFVIHWDAALSSKSCFDILTKRKLSIQFSIDNDGTIYQFLDCNNIAWHAGANEYGSWNAESIGVEVSNAVELKYQKYYEMKNIGSRPLWKNVKVHKKYIGNILGFYLIQEEALKVLIKTVCNYYSIPIQCPIESNKLVTTIYKPVIEHNYSGIVGHYHLTKDKIDVAGLDIVSLLKAP